jgi:hypothetical protein
MITHRKNKQHQQPEFTDSLDAGPQPDHHDEHVGGEG